MSHIPLNDWARLGEEWRTQPRTVTVEQLQRRVQLQTIRLYAVAAVEVLLTIAGVTTIAIALLKGPDLETRLLAGGLGVFTTIVWAFTLRNRRGIWRAAGDTMTAYRALERERLRRRTASARFSWRLCAVALVPMLMLTARRVVDAGLWSVASLISAGACIYLLAWVVGARVVEMRLVRRVASQTDTA